MSSEKWVRLCEFITQACIPKCSSIKIQCLHERRWNFSAISCVHPSQQPTALVFFSHKYNSSVMPLISIPVCLWPVGILYPLKFDLNYLFHAFAPPLKDHCYKYYRGLTNEIIIIIISIISKTMISCFTKIITRWKSVGSSLFFPLKMLSRSNSFCYLE